jgi:hypothetical protein
VEDVGVQDLLALVDELDEALDAAGIGEVVFLAAVALVDRRMRTPLFRKESSRRRLARIS